MPSTPQGHYHILFQYIPLFIKALSKHLSLPPEQHGVVHTPWRTLPCSALLFCSSVSGTVYLTWFHFYFSIVQIFFSFLPFYTSSLVWSQGLLQKKNAHFISVGYKTEQKTVRKVCFLFSCASQDFDNWLFEFVVLSIVCLFFPQTEKQLEL